jgi:Ca-activated chloride channel family protein
MNTFTLFLSNFHFVRPYWLLAVFALFIILWLLKKHRFHQSPWQQFLPNHLSHVLVEKTSNTNTKKSLIGEKAFLIKPFIIGLVSIIALAGPVWKKLPQPVYQTERGSVLIMDMSYSMYSTDVKPNRLTRARFKAIDLLDKINEGDTGLIAYAGDAFIISPLTQDIKNISLLLPSLTPEIMPVVGSNPMSALTLAHEMLLNAGHLNGDIYWFIDDVDNEDISDIYDWSKSFGHQLNILGIGSESGAPITLPSGELLKDNKGAIVVPRLPSQKLQSIASRGQGNYQTISNDDSDLDNLVLKDTISQKNNDKQASLQTGDQWQEQGAWLLLLALPLMLSYFRRGSTLLIVPMSFIPLLMLLSFPLVSPISLAQDYSSKEPQSVSGSETSTQATTSTELWKSLWQTNDQQAQKQYNQENYQGAAQQFEDSQWQGSSHYKAGNYQAALDAFKHGEQANSADSLYNQGNALAQMQKYDEAIESYEEALSKNPELQDAKDNIEKIKQQQKQQEQEKNQQQGDESNKDQEQDKNQENKDNDQEQNTDDSQSQDQQDSEDSQQQNSENDSQEGEKEQEQESESNKSSEEQKNKEQEQKKSSADNTDTEDEQGEEKTPAQIAAEQQEKETEQKHQQLLNKVTDDPYLLLRNKMQLEYQKRKQDGSSRGVTKKW